MTYKTTGITSRGLAKNLASTYCHSQSNKESTTMVWWEKKLKKK